MTGKRRKKRFLSSVFKIFIRKESEYPPALDGKVAPWIPISKLQKKTIPQKVEMKKKGSCCLTKKQEGSKILKTPCLKNQLQKQNNTLFIKNSQPHKNKKIKPVKLAKQSAVKKRCPITLRHGLKIL